MHLFPTTLASLECSSINSESQSRPLAIKVVVGTTTTTTTSKEIHANVPRESVTNRKAATAAAKLGVQISVFGMRDTCLYTDLKRCKSVILTRVTRSKNQSSEVACISIRGRRPLFMRLVDSHTLSCHDPRYYSWHCHDAEHRGSRLRPRVRPAGRFRPSNIPKHRSNFRYRNTSPPLAIHDYR